MDDFIESRLEIDKESTSVETLIHGTIDVGCQLNCRGGGGVVGAEAVLIERK